MGHRVITLCYGYKFFFMNRKLIPVTNFCAQFKPKTSLEAFFQCDSTHFPNINKLLNILCTLPISTATPEFSTLKRVKTYLRNTMGQNRLNGLCMLSVHNV